MNRFKFYGTLSHSIVSSNVLKSIKKPFRHSKKKIGENKNVLPTQKGVITSLFSSFQFFFG